jgi:hypothetical protein
VQIFLFRLTNFFDIQFKKIKIFFKLQRLIKLLSSSTKIAPERHKLQKIVKTKKKCQKNPVFLEFFEYSSNWGQF